MNAAKCPKCHSDEVIPIRYGYPSDMNAAFQAVERGEIKLGGCCISADSPRWYCKQCGHAFNMEATSPEALREAILGCLLGLACGDALGAAVEEMRASEILAHFPQGLREYQKGLSGSLLAGLPAGTFTDDTVMALGLAEAYLELEGEFDPTTIAKHWMQWKKEGPYWELGPGTACNQALDNLIAGASPRASGVNSAGNGGAMRVAPVGILRREDPERCVREAIEQSRITHVHPEADAAAACMAMAVSFLLRHHRQSFDTMTFWDYILPYAEQFSERFSEALWEASMAECLPENVSGYVTRTLPAAFQIFLAHRGNPESAIVTAASAGGDTDTLAALVGALAGAYQGAQRLPQSWIKGLRRQEWVIGVAERLWR